MKRFVVVGGGIAGLYAAAILKLNDRRNSVTILENSNSLGGLLKELRFGEINFDTGVHTFYETGIDEIDTLLYSIVPKGGWNDLIGTKRDIGGAFFADKLHSGNSYFGFDHLGLQRQHEIKIEFLDLIEKRIPEDKSSAQSSLITRFGSTAAKHLSGIVEKFSGKSSADVHSIALDIIPLKRVNLFGNLVSNFEFSSELLRSRLAFPDQRDLPTNLIPQRKAFYPSSYSTQLYIDAFIALLENIGVEIVLNSSIETISESNLLISSGANYFFDELIWTPNPILLSRFFKDTTGDIPNRPSQKTAIVSYLLHERPNMKDLYYAYSFNENHISHRFSSPVNFCENSRVGDLYRFTNEMVFHEDMSLQQLEDRSTRELVEMNIIDPSRIALCRASVIPGGYPDISLSSVGTATSKINQLKSNLAENFHLTGILSDEKTFFQNDVLLKTFEVVRSLTN